MFIIPFFFFNNETVMWYILSIGKSVPISNKLQKRRNNCIPGDGDDDRLQFITQYNRFDWYSLAKLI